ncbi:hypothetical protein, partial [Klebsiella pneumoniae]
CKIPHLNYHRQEVYMTEKLKGTASVLHETKTYEELVEKHSVEVANGLLANAINTALPNAGITSNDVAGFSKVTIALRTGEVDLAKTAKEANADAAAVSANIIAGLKASQKSKDEIK